MDLQEFLVMPYERRLTALRVWVFDHVNLERISCVKAMLSRNALAHNVLLLVPTKITTTQEKL